MNQVNKLNKSDVNKLLQLVEYRLRYLEGAKWDSTNDEARIAVMHNLNIVWSKLVALLDRLD